MTKVTRLPTQQRVLIVDDDLDIREYLEVLLRLDDYQVATASNGVEALVALGQPPRTDLILLDLMMPVMDGWTLLEALRGDPELAAIPVVVLSGTPCEMPLGARDMLLKPSTPRQVLAAVGRLLGPERRAQPRFAAAFPLTAEDGHRTMDATALNLSRGGILFRTSAAAQVGQPLELTLRIEPAGTIRVESQVCHVVADSDGWRIGARFLAVQVGSAELDGVLSSMERGQSDRSSRTE